MTYRGATMIDAAAKHEDTYDRVTVWNLNSGNSLYSEGYLNQTRHE